MQAGRKGSRALAIAATGVLAFTVSPAASAQATWTVVPSPNVSQGNNILRGADAISATDVWAVGRADTSTDPYQETLTMRWSGSAWSTVPSPNPADFNQLNDVDGASAADVWAVGTHIQRWNGSAWNVVNAPSGVFTGVKAFSTTQAWAVGANGRTTLTARWNGSSWSQVPSPSRPGAFNTLGGVDGAAPDDLWAVGSSTLDPNYGADEALILHWNGTSWTEVPAPDQFADLKGVVALSANDVWAVGEIFSIQALPHFVPYAIHWDGTRWSRVTVPDPGAATGSGFNAVTGLAPTKVYAMGQAGDQPFVARWNGTGWSIESTPAAGGPPALNGATATGTGTVWGVGSRFDGTAGRTLTIRTTNG